VISKISPYSYRLLIEDGATRTLHANRLRKFITQVNSIGIVFEADNEFGRLDTCLISADVAGADKDMEGDRFDNSNLSHLSTTEQHQLRNLLRRYDKVFDDRPGTCNVSNHEIKLVEVLYLSDYTPTAFQRSFVMKLTDKSLNSSHKGRSESLIVPSHTLWCVL